MSEEKETTQLFARIEALEKRIDQLERANSKHQWAEQSTIIATQQTTWECLLCGKQVVIHMDRKPDKRGCIK